MIRYQYLHVGNEYRSKFSIERSDGRYYFCENLFEKLRSAVEGNSFTYLPLPHDECVTVQACEQERTREQFVEGLLFDSANLRGKPSKYIGKLAKSPSASDLSGEILSVGMLPDTGRRTEDYSITRNLKHIFGKLTDILIYGKKDDRIIIVAESREEGENYLKALSLIFPSQFLKNIGFSIGCSKIPSRSLSVEDRTGETINLGFKIIVPDLANYDYETYSMSGYLFDTRAMRDNYTIKLSSFGAAVDELDLGNESAVTSFANKIEKAFLPNGGVDTAMLERLVCLYLFDIHFDDIVAAKKVLNLKYDNDLEIEFINAANLVLDCVENGKAQQADVELVRKAMGCSENIAFAVKDKYCNFLINQFDKLNGSDREQLINYLLEDNTYAKLGELVFKAQSGGIEQVNKAYELIGDMLVKALSCGRRDIFNDAAFIENVVNLVDARNFRRMGSNGNAAGKLFSVAVDIKNESVAHFLAACLMASAYYTDTDERICELRVSGLRQALQVKKLEPLEELSFVNGIRRCVLDIFAEMGVGADEFNFVYNVHAGKKWLSGLIDKLSIVEALKIENEIYADGNNFESLTLDLRAKLLDIDYVRENIKSGNEELRSDYENFFYHLPEDKKRENAHVEAYIDQLSGELNVSVEFIKYRSDFIYECYKTMSPANQTALLKGETAESMFYDKDLIKRKTVIENTVDLFGMSNGENVHSFKNYKGAIIRAALLGFLTLIILMIPPVIISASLGEFASGCFLERLLWYAEVAYFVLPLYNFGLYITTYFVVKKDKLSYARMVTFFCGLLPVVIYALASTLFYYIRF